MDNFNRYDAFPSSASEAVISADGRVQRLASSYELDTPSTRDDQLIPFPDEATNDSEINELPSSVGRSTGAELKRPPKPKASYLGLVTVFLFVLGTFGWTSLSLFHSPKSVAFNPSSSQLQSTPSNASDHRDQTTPLATESRDSDQVVSTQPGIGSHNEQSNVPATTAHPGANDNARYERVMQDLAREIAAAEKAANRNRDPKGVSEKAMNEQLKKQLSTDHQDIISKKHPAPGKHQQRASVRFTQDRIVALLRQYKDAYEQGNLAALLALFGADQLTKQRIANLRTQFQPVFANTAKRSISFKAIKWQRNENIATVTSAYRAILELKNNKGTQNISADATIRVLPIGNSLRVASVHLANLNVNVQTPELSQPVPATEVKKPAAASSRNTGRPTPAQLQYITTQLVSAYEAGDIDKFKSLFAKDVKSNDRLDRAGLMKDYQQLFETSSDRQMFIQNMRWQNAPMGVKGTGDLQVMVLSKNGSDVYSMEGKIEIVAQRRNKDVLITHIYHIERQK